MTTCVNPDCHIFGTDGLVSPGAEVRGIVRMFRVSIPRKRLGESVRLACFRCGRSLKLLFPVSLCRNKYFLTPMFADREFFVAFVILFSFIVRYEERPV